MDTTILLKLPSRDMHTRMSLIADASLSRHIISRQYLNDYGKPLEAPRVVEAVSWCEYMLRKMFASERPSLQWPYAQLLEIALLNANLWPTAEQIVLDAIQRSNLDREKVIDEIRYMEPGNEKEIFVKYLVQCEYSETFTATLDGHRVSGLPALRVADRIAEHLLDSRANVVASWNLGSEG